MSRPASWAVVVTGPRSPFDEGQAARSPMISTISTMTDDPNGQKCPFASHARRTNPRNRRVNGAIASSDAASPTRMATRQGMLFVCFNARIDTQFEFLQSEWCKKGDFLGAFTEVRDPLVGGGGTFLDPGRPIPFSLRILRHRPRRRVFLRARNRRARSHRERRLQRSPRPRRPPKDASPEGADQTSSPDQTFDPITYPEHRSGDDLLQDRAKSTQKRVAWASGKQQGFLLRRLSRSVSRDSSE